MEKTKGVLSPKQVLKMWARKFLRLAPAYYTLWAVTYVLSARGGNGANWHNMDENMQTCGEDWIYTLFMIGNIYPQEMIPYAGCYQMAWPL